jgi:hypothetical protein
METWAKVGIAAFIGKVFASLFIAVCVVIGFGPEKWAAYLVTGTPFTPSNLRAGLLVLASAVALNLVFPFIRKIALRVDPWHVIVIGLVIAAVGVGWQIYRGPILSQAEIDKITAPLQAQIASLKAQQDKPFWNPGNPAPPPPLPKRYTAYEKEQRLRAVDEIYNVFATELAPAYVEGRDLFNGLKNELVKGDAAQKLRAHYDTVENAFKKLDGLRNKYEYFSDIVAVTKQNTFNGLTEMVACDNLINAIALLQNIAPNNVGQLLDRDIVYVEARNANMDFDKFLKDTMPRLQQKRTEIEAAEVYSGNPK